MKATFRKSSDKIRARFDNTSGTGIQARFDSTDSTDVRARFDNTEGSPVKARFNDTTGTGIRAKAGTMLFPYFRPHVSEEGELSWTNNGGLENPTPVSIRGPKGDTGEQGPKGDPGDVSEAVEKAEEALTAAQAAQQTADVAATAASIAHTAAGSAQATASTALAAAQAAQQTADDAQTAADSAQATADAALANGLPDGGTAGQVVTKTADGAEWADIPGWDLLWTNASPGSSFGAQSIAVDLSGYDFILIYSFWSTGYLQYIAPFIAFVPFPSSVIQAVQNNNAASLEREFAVTSSGVRFNKATRGSNTDNSCLIPVRIYGIKGVA